LPSPNGESVVNCNGISALPNITFTVADKPFTLTPEQVGFTNFDITLHKSKASVKTTLNVEYFWLFSGNMKF